MPRVHRKVKRRTELTQMETHFLTRGWSLFNGDFGDDIEAALAAWREYGDGILADWIADRPGTRPWAWWKFDATERRQRIDRGTHPFDNPERIAKVARVGYADDMNVLSFGKPSCLVVVDDFEAEYETETDYLARLGLLAIAERESLTKA